MKNTLNLLMKTALTLIILFLLIPIFGKSTWTQTIVTGIILVLLSYIAGDLWILPKYGNMPALIADFVLAAAVIWLMMKALPHFVLTSGGVWVTALVLALGEWLFHLYLQATHAPGKKVD
ncbi:MAG: DUF2512 family protein [Bacillota bacterium]